MVPVVQAKRHVAVLLNLEHHDVAAQGMNCPGRGENGIAGLRYETRESIRHRAVCKSLPHIVSSGTWLQTGIDAAGWPRFEHDPCFGLAGLAHRQQVRVGIRGVHLDREHFVGVEKFQ